MTFFRGSILVSWTFFKNFTLPLFLAGVTLFRGAVSLVFAGMTVYRGCTFSLAWHDFYLFGAAFLEPFFGAAILFLGPFKKTTLPLFLAGVTFFRGSAFSFCWHDCLSGQNLCFLLPCLLFGAVPLFLTGMTFFRGSTLSTRAHVTTSSA